MARIVVALFKDAERGEQAAQALRAEPGLARQVRLVPHDGVEPHSRHLMGELDLGRDEGQPPRGESVLLVDVADDDLAERAAAICAGFDPLKVEKRLPPEERTP